MQILAGVGTHSVSQYVVRFHIIELTHSCTACVTDCVQVANVAFCSGIIRAVFPAGSSMAQNEPSDHEQLMILASIAFRLSDPAKLTGCANQGCRQLQRFC